MTPSRVLVTGATSRLGQAVGRCLRRHGHIAHATSRTKLDETVLSLFEQIHHLDLSDPAGLGEIREQFDSIIHVAAAYQKTPRYMMRVNGMGTSALAEWAVSRDIPRLVCVSSMAVYGEVNVDEVSAATSVRHSNPYGLSRWAADCYLHSLRSQLSSVCVRSCAIVGQDSDYHFLSKILKDMTAQQPVIQVSNPDFLFNNVIHEDTLASFLVHLALTHQSNFSSVPVGSTGAIPLSEIIGRMSSATKYRGQVDWIASTSRPFCIDVGPAVQLGLRPMQTSETIDRWLKDALTEIIL